MISHPFLEDTFHIAWSTLKPSAIEEDIRKAITQAKAAIQAISEQPLNSLNYNNTLIALENATEPLDNAWGKVGHLDSVCNSEDLREAHNAVLPQVSAFYTEIFLNEDLWRVIEAYSKTADAQKLTGAHKRFLDETIADFEENGARLSSEDKVKLADTNKTLAELCQKYSENVLDATNAWELIVEDKTKLKGLPESAIEAAFQDALKLKKCTQEAPAWRFTLHMPSFLPVMQYMEDDTLRQQIWQASASVAFQAPHDNTELIWRILALRQQKAELLGFEHFSDFVLKRRMAVSGKKALNFIEDLHDRIAAPFNKENTDLEEFVASKRNQAPTALEPWQFGYWSELRKKEMHDFDDELLRPYFPIEQVMSGLFQLTEKIFAIQVQEKPTVFYPDSQASENKDPNTIEVWHEDVKFYDILDTEGTLLGSFYADWFPRDTKRGGAWMNHLKTGGPNTEGLHAPHLGLICGNLTAPIGDQPALLNHREVETVFHEFGHLLHHVLGSVPVKSLNGTNVAWDFVELPSQIMENWCWERESLDLFAKHHRTGEVIPEALFNKMLATRNYMTAMGTMRQLSLSKMDLELHMHYSEFKQQELESVIKAILAGYLPRYNTQPPSIIRRFSHLFSSPTGYAAGYYSYKWAEVLDADAFTRFQEEGILNPNTGMDFRNCVLSKGNSEAPEVLFKNFMGRDPDLSALLKRSALEESVCA